MKKYTICLSVSIIIVCGISFLSSNAFADSGGTPSRGNYNYGPNQFDNRTMDERGTLRGAVPDPGTPFRGNYNWYSPSIAPSNYGSGTATGTVSSFEGTPFRGNYFFEPTPLGYPSGNVPTRGGGVERGTPSRGNYQWKPSLGN